MEEWGDKDALFEYDFLRKEIEGLRQAQSQFLSIATPVLAGIILYFFSKLVEQEVTVNFLFFFVPFFIIFPFLLIQVSHLQATMRLASYIEVFLEKHKILYETRGSKFYNFIPKGLLWYVPQSRSIFVVYASFGLLDIGFFLWQGFYGFWHIFSYIAVFAIYALLYKRFFSVRWTEYYKPYWEQVKESE